MVMKDPIKVKAAPTKELFVHILTRDIAHQAAIIELIDNAVDGAKRVAEDSEDLSTFWVEIGFDREKFLIHDNCGGIPLSVAVDYAFRFGRAEGMKNISGFDRAIRGRDEASAIQLRPQVCGRIRDRRRLVSVGNQP